MTPKEKAEELVKKYVAIVYRGILPNHSYLEQIKQCALIAVDEIMSLDTSAPYQEENYIQKFYSEVRLEIINIQI